MTESKTLFDVVRKELSGEAALAALDTIELSYEAARTQRNAYKKRTSEARRDAEYWRSLTHVSLGGKYV